MVVNNKTYFDYSRTKIILQKPDRQDKTGQMTRLDRHARQDRTDTPLRNIIFFRTLKY